MKQRIEVPELPQPTDDVLHKVDIMLQSISATENISAMEEHLKDYIAPGTQRRCKAKLRKLFEMKSNEPLHSLCAHPQLRTALAMLFTRKTRDDAGVLLSAKSMIVVVGTGEYVSVEDFLVSIYSHPGHNANKAHEALLDACRSQRVKRVENDVHFDVTADQLPAESSVTRFLRQQRSANLALRRSRMSREQRTRDNIFISRPKDEYRPGGLLEGDHTEDNILVYRNDGKIAPLWWTILVDVRTGLIKSYEIAYRPNSNTIALAFKHACLGTQLFAAVETRDGIEYKPANIVDAPDILRYDNGKDYKSARTGESVGKVDFSDEARRSAQLLCEIQHTGRRHPQAKGHVEGTFGIIQQCFLKYLPGFKGSNYAKKPDALASEVKAGALLTEDEYRELASRAVNALNNKPRAELGDVSPLQFYMMNQAEMKFVDERALNFLQMKWVGRNGDGVKIHRGYVRMLGGEYFSMDLDHLNGERAHLYYDPAEIGRVAVYVNGEFVTFAVDKELLGVSEKDWLCVVKERARRNKEIAGEIQSLRQGMTLEDAKALIFNAAIRNVSAVDPALMQKRVPAIVKLTGIESKAKEFQTKLEAQKNAEEGEKKRKKLAAATPLSLIDTGKIR